MEAKTKQPAARLRHAPAAPTTLEHKVPQLIAVSSDQRSWFPLGGCTLVEVPNDYAGSDPLREGRPVASLHPVHDDAPPSCCGDPVCESRTFFAFVCDDGETFTAINEGVELVEMTDCPEILSVEEARGLVLFGPPEQR